MKKSWISLSILMLLFSRLMAFGPVKDLLKQRLVLSADSSKVLLLSDLCWEYRAISPDSAILFGLEALQLAKDLLYQKGMAQAYNDLGIIYIDKADYKKAVGYLNESMKIRSELNDKSGMAALYNKLGIIDQKQGRLKEALQNQIEALKMFRELGQEKWIGHTLNNIAIIHQNLGDFEKALEYHKMGLEYRLKLNDLQGEATSYTNMANLYAKMRDTTLSLTYYGKALDLSRNLKNKELISTTLSNLANIYMARKDYLQATQLFSESLAIREQLGDAKGISSILSRMGAVYTETGRYREASVALNRSLKISKNISVVEEELSALMGLAKLKALTHQLDSAFILMNDYIATRDSVYDQRIKQQIVEVQNKYENEKLEQDLELTRKEKEFAEVKLSQRKTQIWLLIFVMISLSGAAIFLFYLHKKRQQAAVDRDRILQQEARMNAVFQGQEEERRRIAKELHDGIGQTLSAIKLNYNALTTNANGSDQLTEFKKLEKMLDSASIEVRSISHQMMPVELEQFGLVPAIESMLELNLAKTPIRFSFEHNGFEGRFGTQIELALYRVLQELVNNVIKHSKANLLNVQLLKLANHLVFIVTDNGVGFDVEAQEKKGIGLLNIAGRIDGINGHLHYESIPGNGTTITIRTPLI
jgi:signal transduction histidine kinase